VEGTDRSSSNGGIRRIAVVVTEAAVVVATEAAVVAETDQNK